MESNTNVTTTAKILVAIGVNPSSERLLKRALTLAHALEAPLLAVHIHPPGSGTQASSANVDWHLENARQLGAHVEIIHGSDVAVALVTYARAHGITHLVLGQSDVTRWQEVVRASLINRILHMRTGLDLYIVGDANG